MLPAMAEGRRGVQRTAVAALRHHEVGAQPAFQ